MGRYCTKCFSNHIARNLNNTCSIGRRDKRKKDQSELEVKQKAKDLALSLI